MELNLPVWGYYPPNDEKFLDPLYAPYQKVPAELKSDGLDGGGYCGINTWKTQGSPTGFVFPELVKKGYGWNFQKMHPDKDMMCPAGWTGNHGLGNPSIYGQNPSGICVREEPEYEGIFYTDKAFVPKYQYWSSYAPPFDCSPREINEFDMRSFNPRTGNTIRYFESSPGKYFGKYGKLASKDSLIA